MASFFNASYCNMVSEVEYEPMPEYSYSRLKTNFNIVWCYQLIYML